MTLTGAESRGTLTAPKSYTLSSVKTMETTWRPVLLSETEKPYWKPLQQFVRDERKKYTVFPPDKEVFAALHLTPYEKVSVLILGQDPYHEVGQAHGLCFSVRPNVSIPPSLQNIYKELHDDLGCQIPNNGCLTPWAEQGVLLLNAVLTVRAHQANSHQGKGWENFTDAIIRAANDKPDRVVFVLWGAYARKKAPLIDTTRHIIIQSAHPSPLSASNGFFGSRPFSKINTALREAGKPEIDWQIPDL
jgi:uracil-DNA glycosylase